MQIRPIRTYLLILVIFLAAACEQASDTPAPKAADESPVQDTREATRIFWEAGKDVLSATLQQAQQLQQLTHTFLKLPTEDSLTTLRDHWFHVQAQWQRFYFFSQLGVSQPVIFGQLAEYSFRIAAHPIQPGYLDYFGPYPYSGLVHDISVPLTPESLLNQHGMTDPEDVTLGIYAIEFLLNGEQLKRPASDYNAVTQLSAAQQEQGFRQVNETPNYRRRELLSVQMELLVRSLTELKALWESEAEASLLHAWQTLEPDQQHAAITNNLERALTQLLLDIVAATPAEAGTEVEPRYDSSLSPAALAGSIRALNAAGAWLPPKKQQALKDCLQLSAEAVNSAQTREDWSAVYQHLKSCLITP